MSAEAWGAVVIAALMALGLFGSCAQHDKFKTTCDRAGGTTVYDGRQWQCIKPTPDGKAS